MKKKLSILLSALFFISTYSQSFNTAVKNDSAVIFNNKVVVISSNAFESEAIAYFNKLTVQPNNDVIFAINKFIKDQKDSSLWDKKDRIFLLASTSETDCVIDLKGVENCSLVNSPTFTKYRGVTTISTTYINTNFNPAIDAIAFQLNNNFTCYWMNTLTPISNSSIRDFGIVDGTNSYYANVRNTGNNFKFQPPFSSTTSTRFFSNTTNYPALYHIIRSASNNSKAGKNGVDLSTTYNDVSIELINGNIYIGSVNNIGSSPSISSIREYSYFDFGKGLSIDEKLTNYSQIKTLLTVILNQ